MPSPDLLNDNNIKNNDDVSRKGPEELLFDAIAGKDLDKIKRIVAKYPKINLNCIDKDELSPLQHACHFGDLEMARFFLDSGADVNFSRRKDKYTALMFAAIGSRSDVVRLLLERGIDTTVENCVNRTAAQMAAFVGQSKVVSIINSWVPYKSSVEPYTRSRELENEPRIPSNQLGILLHNYVVFPSLHPVKLFLHIKDNKDLVKYGREFIYVLENLCSKSLKPPMNEESLSLKYYYLSYLIDYCLKSLKKSNPTSERGQNSSNEFDDKTIDKCIEAIVKRLIKRDDPEELRICNQQLDQFILECLMKYPYTQLTIYKTMTFALTKRQPGDYTALAILTQTLNGPRMFNQPVEACIVCGEMDNNKKCSNCKLIYYCSRSCQKADWFQHKKICRSPDEIPLLKENNDPNDATVLI